MYARVTTIKISPYRQAEAIGIIRDQVLPAAQQQNGFKGSLMLADQSEGKSMVITLWAEEADRQVTGPESEYYRDAIGRIVPLLLDTPTVEDFELVIAR